jgi:hypothetical protein
MSDWLRWCVSTHKQKSVRNWHHFRKLHWYSVPNLADISKRASDPVSINMDVERCYH